MDLESLYEIIYTIYTDCEVTEFPIDCLAVVHKCGYRIKKYSELTQKKKAACQKLSGDACLIEDTLFYEENAHPGRMKFSIAHELGHVFLNTDDEDDCDYFASHFLAPRIMIHKMGHQNAQQIHDIFGLSYAAANRALADYRRWFHRSYFVSIQPSKPEVLLSQMFIKTPSREQRRQFFSSNPDFTSDELEITDEMRFAHLKNSYLAKRKASMLGISINEYLMYQYNFRF